LGSANKTNVAKAVVLALASLKDPQSEVAKRNSGEKPQEATSGG
jgi:ribosomal protein S5